MQRDAAWRAVWTERDADRADWNGYEACFETPEAYAAWVDQVAALVRAELQVGSGDTIADLGCGTGRMVDLLAPHVGAVRGFDFSQPALTVAAERTARHGNVSLATVDLNDPPPDLLAGVDKAYSVAVLYYLKSVDHVLDLVSDLAAAGTDLLLIDLPDADRVDARARDYDQGLYSHLSFRDSDFTSRFPGARVLRGCFPDYVNDEVRFTVRVPGARGA